MYWNSLAYVPCGVTIILLFSFQPSSEKSSIIECLKSLVSSVTPECLIPSLDATSVILNRTVPHKCDDYRSLHTSEGGSEIPHPSHNGNITTSSCDGGSHDSHMRDKEASKEEVKIKIPSEVSKCIESFAQYCHERWVYEKVWMVLGFHSSIHIIFHTLCISLNVLSIFLSFVS